MAGEGVVLAWRGPEPGLGRVGSVGDCVDEALCTPLSRARRSFLY